MDSEGRICLLYDFVLRYICHGSFYEVITNLWLSFSSVFCSSVVLVSVFLFCQIGHDFMTCYSMLLLAYVLRNQLQVSNFSSMQENLHRATMYVIDHLSNEMQGCRNLVWVSWRRIVLPLFFLLLQGSKKKPFVSNIKISAWRCHDALDCFFLRARDIRFLERDDIGYHFRQTVSRYEVFWEFHWTEHVGESRQSICAMYVYPPKSSYQVKTFHSRFACKNCPFLTPLISTVLFNFVYCWKLITLWSLCSTSE
jgi:hypothetical protein